ncbi:hypothetical protein CIT26_17080 [Mesorhizobium temperatum]|uniref:Uncharacterized protein n=2 Tax=Mesorhizobium TaxID=68287 RepID=A0A271LLD2_9HYPH|nr:hypothetical protein CIT26_17080 [Mesorhizobium temperatum]
MGSRIYFCALAKKEKEMSITAYHGIVNDCIFLLIFNPALVRNCDLRLVVGAEDFLPVLPQGQTCTAADSRNT